MRTKVRVSHQVEFFVKALAPEPRLALQRAIKGLSQDKGDIRRLEGKLSGYHRLRVAGYRVIYAERYEAGHRIVECVFAKERSVVYDMFLQLRAQEFGE
jgi:mRNA-degrading endonuclease RelE of RelBE toxin-antitoxin system